MPSGPDILVPLEPIPTGETTRLPDLSGVRVMFFDIYGTLLTTGIGDVGTTGFDRAAEAEKAWRQCFGDHPAPTESWADSIRRFQHKEKLKGADYPEIDIREVWAERLASVGIHLSDEQRNAWILYHECCINPVWIMPGSVSLLEKLKGAGIRLGIISNAQYFTPGLLEFCLGRKLRDLGFEESLTVWSYQLRRGKPSASLFEQASHQLYEAGLESHQMLMVGNDLRNDIAVPFYMGWKTLLFAGDARSLRWHRDSSAMKGVRPDGVITSWADLEAVFS